MHRRDFLIGTGAALTTAAIGWNRNSIDPLIEMMDGKAWAATGKAPGTSRDSILWTVTRAYQRMIAMAEGTWIPGRELNPYQVIFGYRKFESFADHPRRSYPIPGSRYSSDAAGMYQFLSSTWDKTVRRNSFWYDGDTFSPINQDLGFLYLHRDTGAHDSLSGGCRTHNGLTYVNYIAWSAAIYKDSIEWASLPGHNIGASTGQRTKPMDRLWSWFTWELAKEQGLLAPTIFPLGGYNTSLKPSSRFGLRWHPVEGGWRNHGGVDHPVPTGTPFLAPEDGRVVATYELLGGGLTLEFRPSSHPFRLIRVMHLSSFITSPGQWVAQGDELALTGSTGRLTTGPHSHIELWEGLPPTWEQIPLHRNGAPVDPERYLKLGDFL